MQQAQRICRATKIPLLVDGDHGYGNALNVARTIEELANVGVTAHYNRGFCFTDAIWRRRKHAANFSRRGSRQDASAVAARPDELFVVIGRTNAGSTNFEDVIERLAAYERAGVDALFIVGLKSETELSAIADATTAPLILANISTELESANLPAYRVRINLQGHLPIMAAVQSVYDTMKALRNGTRPVDLRNVVSGELLKTLTRASSYDEATRKYLS